MLQKVSLKRGFTMIELVYVLLIIGILAGVVMVAMGGNIKNAKEKATIRAIEQIYEAAVGWASRQTPVSFNPPSGAVSVANLQAGGFLRAGYDSSNSFGGTETIAPNTANDNQVIITSTNISADSCATLMALYTKKAEAASCSGTTLTITY